MNPKEDAFYLEQINKIPDTGFYVTGPDIGRPLRYVSESMTEILGYSVDEFAMMYKTDTGIFFMLLIMSRRSEDWKRYTAIKHEIM